MEYETYRQALGIDRTALASRPKGIALKISRAAIIAVCLMALAIPAAALDLGPLKAALEKFVAGKAASIGVAVIYDGTDVVTLNNEIEYPLMSVFKLHQAIAVFRELERKNIPLSQEIHIKAEDLLPDTYSPLRDRHPQGGIRLSIRDLLSFSLQLSDNNACDILFDRILSPAGTDKIIRSFGMEAFSISQTEANMHRDLANCGRNWSTPLALAELIEKTLAGETLSKKHTQLLKEMLIGCKTGADRLPKPLPPSIVIGHKTGTGDRNGKQEIIGLNDAGFVILPDGKRYVIAVLIKNSRLSYAATAEIISRISDLVYKYIEGARSEPAAIGPAQRVRQHWLLARAILSR